MRAEKYREFLYIFLGAIALLSCAPRLLIADDESRAEGSTFMEVIETDFFKFAIVATFGMSFPLTFDILTELPMGKRIFVSPFEWEQNTSCRLILWVALVLPPLLYMKFSFIDKNLIATSAIQQMRTILNVLLLTIQCNWRTTRVHTSCAVSFAFIFFIIGSVFKTYTINYSLSDSYQLAGSVARLVSLAFISFAIGRHLWMYCTGQLTDYSSKWQAVLLEVLIIIPVIWLLVIARNYDFGTIYDQNGLMVNGYNVMMSLVVACMNAVLSTETRFKQALITEKLDMKRLFVRFISHEVRTPLNSCVLGLEYMKKKFMATDSTPSPEESIALLEEIACSCKTAVEFMDNLLLYEKVDSLQLPLYRTTEDLVSICEAVNCSFQLSAQELGVRLELEVADCIQKDKTVAALASVDKSKIAVVFRNLFSNALKFTPRGGKVTCSIAPVTVFQRKDSRVVYSEAPTHIRVTVSDTGPGLTPAERATLFKEFVQFSPNELQQGGGSGIGLYLCHKIVQQHDIDIKVISEKGKGASFVMDFPIAENNTLPAHISLNVEGGIEEKSPDQCDDVQPFAAYLCDISILIVDDSPLMRKMLKRTLQQNDIGAQIDEAGDGLELLNFLGAPVDGRCVNGEELKSYDVLIVDNHMPRMGGRAAIAILRKCGYTGIIVGHTGDASSDDLQAFCTAGADIALPKPFDVENFKDYVHSRLRRSVRQDAV